MSKGNRKREAQAAKQLKRLEQEKFEAKQRRVRKITTIVTVVLLAALFATLIGGCAAQNIKLNRGEYLRSEIAASSKNIDVDGAMMNYFFNDTYNSFLSYYGSYISYFGLNPSMSLKLQQVSETETWFDYLMTGAKDTVTNTLKLCEAAKAEGVALTDAEIAAVRTRADRTDTKLYGRGTNKNDIFNAKLLEALAYKYQIIKENELTPSDADVNARYEDNTKSYQFVDYVSFPLYYVDAEKKDVKPARDQKAIVTEEDVKGFAEELKAATSVDEFKAAATDVLKAENADIAEKDIETALAALATADAVYTKDDKVSEWAFDAKVGDTYVAIDAEKCTYTVYMLTEEAHRDETRTINVRHVLLYDDTYKNREGALKKAEELLTQFQSVSATDAFALMALQYSEDPGSCYNGGLYLNVLEGSMVESFDKWCFDESRKAGDTGIVESEFGVHIMYFEGEGGEVWQATVRNDIINEGLEKLDTEWKKEYTVEFDNNVLDSIPG